MVRKILVIIGVAIAAAAAAIYFSGYTPQLYQVLGKSVEQAMHIDLQDTLSQVAQEVSTPPPLQLPISPLSKQVVLTAGKIIAETNLQRQENGDLPPVTENAELTAAAEAKAKDMFENQYFEHESPTGITPAELVQSYGYDYLATGENLILGSFDSEQEAVQLWMDSPGHRANILNGKYEEIGVAIVKGTYKGQEVWIGVQEFGRPASDCQAPNGALKASIDQIKQQLKLIGSQLDVRKQELQAMDQHDPDYQQKVTEYNGLVAQFNEMGQESRQYIRLYNDQVKTYNACISS